MTPKEIFAQQGYALVKGFISKDLAKFLYDYLLVTTRAAQFNGGSKGDEQVFNALSALHGDPGFEALLWNVHSKMEECCRAYINDGRCM